MAEPFDCTGTDIDPLFDETEALARLRAFHQDMRALKRLWQAGDTTAIPKAIQRLLVQQRNVEGWWVLDAVEALVKHRMPDEEKRLRREFEEHQRRWEALVELRARRFELFERGNDAGMSWEKARAAVAELFGVSDATVKASYDLIQAAGGEDATVDNFRRVRASRTNI
jgi:hypothetical protein